MRTSPAWRSSPPKPAASAAPQTAVVPVRHDVRNGPAGGHRTESVEQDEALGGGYVMSIVDDPLPLYRSVEYDSLDRDDPRCRQSMKRAADAWWSDGQPDVVRAQLQQELAENDRLAGWRLRAMSWDLSEAIDWTERAASRARARRATALRDAGYSQPERTPAPWFPEDLDRANWREDGPPSPNLPAHLRFRRHDAYWGA
jgi:hypothetical protein